MRKGNPLEALSRDRQHEIAAQTQGSCHSSSSIVEQILEEDKIECDDLDVDDMLLDCEIELCQGCGWWFEVCELNGNGECSDCAPESDDE